MEYLKSELSQLIKKREIIQEEIFFLVETNSENVNKKKKEYDKLDKKIKNLIEYIYKI